MAKVRCFDYLHKLQKQGKELRLKWNVHLMCRFQELQNLLKEKEI